MLESEAGGTGKNVLMIGASFAAKRIVGGILAEQAAEICFGTKITRSAKAIQREEIPFRGLERVIALVADEGKTWTTYARRYRAEMRRPAAQRLLEVLAALSRQTNFSVGCYCEDESHCHRSLLKQLLIEKGAQVV